MKKRATFVVPWVLLSTILITGCSGSSGTVDAGLREAPASDGRLFTKLPATYTGVAFENRLVDTRELNVFTYRNYYNGGGVALGDLTGDRLPELLLSSNQQGLRLYLNEGGFRFRDVTEAAGLVGRNSWATGVTFADVNGDGLLDLYVCYAGRLPPARRANELYIHQGHGPDGVPAFAEAAAGYGLADEGYSTHAAFFDYDRDGDLDAYVVNNSPRPVSSFGLRNTRHVRDPSGGDRLYRNDGGRFADVSEQAGIFGGEIAFGLGVAIGDVNGDGWPDVYVSNDFFERDYLYLNQADGSFREELESRMPYVSLSSMGLDLADIDNDGWPDLYVTDMLPEDEARLKMNSSFESRDEARAKLKNGYYHQFTRNMLHLSNRDGTFTEIGQLAGVARTDWSWSALIADFDLDGRKDIHVTNGMPRDLTAQDYLAYLASDATLVSAIRDRKVDFLRLVREMTTTPLPDYAFRNEGDLTFADRSSDWGLDAAGSSNGAAYGDLDGDGALDLVVNNIDEPASIYRNDARALLPGNRWLQVQLEGAGANRFGVGSKVALRSGDAVFYQELMPSRGFQSSVDYVLTFGLGGIETVDSVTVEWPDGRVSVIRNAPTNQRLTVLEDGGAVARGNPSAAPPPLFMDVTDQVALDFVHRENEFDDTDREPLIPKLLSTEGPALAVGDVNGDGLDDLYLGGAKDQPGRLLVQQPDGRFTATNDSLFERDRTSEDVSALFFDANGDGRPDLYVVSGGSEFSDMAPALRDRLYLNDGRAGFHKADGHLPAMDVSGSRVVAADYDGDRDVDLFVGGRVTPWRYGESPRSVLLSNDGRGRFTDVTSQVAPGLARVGMVTDAAWRDVVGDGRIDLVVVGEWLPITIFRNAGGARLERIEARGLEESEGWWNRILAGDFTGDGRADFLLGNAGLNTRFRPTADEPLAMYVADLDRNGFVEQILASYSRGVRYPVAMRDDLLRTLPYLSERFPRYEDYAGLAFDKVISPAELAGAIPRTARTFASMFARNHGDGSFTAVPLPLEAQVAPVYGFLAQDFDGDDRLDLLLVGNFGGVRPEIGSMTAGWGLFLRGDGTGGFTVVRSRESGFRVPGEARDIQRVRTRRGELYVIARNNDRPLVFRVQAPAPLAIRR